ncbi:ArnT family glycosyltransferase [Variovorax sp. N23]|uniref:ArnT family glycosyltransferase n=1 Tax=Variovorax sp. N23 TaxID=2980555 RepID=UPI0021C9276D|nr:glycosyltransferase family 39 protein [Variovorax sp. N23]MCU4118369.1 glycosyltransferase family 39 protein [Variovorax sp. N23]
MGKLGFLLSQYGALALVVAACWGWGEALLRLLKIDRDPTTRLGAPLAITLGLGIGICVLQGLAIVGYMTVHFVSLLVAVGILLGAWHALAGRASLRLPAWRIGWKAMPPPDRWGLAALAAVLFSTLTAPLPPPTQWDELMYHLPHAQQWAASGHLTVNEWLRYPWFPYDFDLLYAGALLFGNDVLPHLLHALAGWLTAWLIYRLGVQHLDRLTACVAASLWVLLAADDFTRAYIDMGVALFVLVAGVAYQAWRTTEDRRWLATCAFALGLAVGSKYQALTLLPLFAVGLIWHDRRPTTWLLVVVALLVPCIYWYGRNALLTGDPFNPIGGRIFGFTDWNAADHQAQFEDLRRVRGWPAWPLWPALAAPFIPALRRSVAARRAMIMGGYMILTWAVSVPYPRYLQSAYPLLVLLSAAASVCAIRLASSAWPFLRKRTIVLAAASLLLLYLALMATAEVVRYWKRISPTLEARTALLTQRVPGYAMWTYVKAHPVGRIYQLGNEDSLFYAPQPVWGEIFGPWRYRDYASLGVADLHRKLAAEKFDALVIHTERLPQFVTQPDFARYFEGVWTEGPVKLYKLKPGSTP